jgi:hypothetical protein
LVISEICATSSLAATRGSNVLAVGGGRRKDVAVVRGQRQRLLGDVFGQAVGELRAVGDQHLGIRRRSLQRLRLRRRVGAGDQYMNIAAALARR